MGIQRTAGRRMGNRFARFVILLLLGTGLALAGGAMTPAGAAGGDDHGASDDHSSSQEKAPSNKKSKDKEESKDKKNEEKKQEEQQKNEEPEKAEKPSNYDQLIARAHELAGKDYKPPKKIPDFLSKLSEEELQKITFKRADALWYGRKKSFQAMFYHPGSFYDHTVNIYVVQDGKAHAFNFNKDDFDYPDKDLQKKVPDDLGFVGFKLLYALNNPEKMDEVISFLGASYFRALGTDEQYGQSARGLAIDTGDMKTGEEFPNFTDFWLIDPGKYAGQMTVYALLNSPSVTGAYKFIIRPGDATHVRVEETLFTRKAISKLEIAPLTSMFTWGKNSLSRLQKYRPEVHDSDGMLIYSDNGEWLWRPLVNPQKLRMNQFDAGDVRGFGLSQRERKFADYQDLDLHFERRPSTWITPYGDWGKGHVELVQIPSDSPVNDNIALYWVPEKTVEAKQKLHFVYDIKWSKDLTVPDTLGHVAATRIGEVADKPGDGQNRVRLSIDFVGGRLEDLTRDDAVQAKLSAGRDVKPQDVKLVRNPHTRGWRLLFSVQKSDLSKPLELRAYLTDKEGNSLTETWSYQLALP